MYSLLTLTQCILLAPLPAIIDRTISDIINGTYSIHVRKKSEHGCPKKQMTQILTQKLVTLECGILFISRDLEPPLAYVHNSHKLEALSNKNYLPLASSSYQIGYTLINIISKIDSL